MLIYAHGFRDPKNSPESRKAKLLRENLLALTPTLPMMPADAIQVLRGHIAQVKEPVLMGHSLGGFYATYLSQQLNIPAVLTNPIVHPSRSPLLRQILWDTPEMIPTVQAQLKAMEVAITRPDNLLVMLQKADKSLGYKQALRHYKDCNYIVLNGGSHRFDDFHQWLPTIANFVGRHNGDVPQEV